MTATLEPVRPAHGGPAPRWSPRRLGHHRYLWWLGALLLAGLAAAIAVGLDPSPEPGIPDEGAITVLTVVILATPVLLWGLVHQFVSAVSRRVRDDVRHYGTGQPVRARRPDAAEEAAGVRAVVDVDHAAGAVVVREQRDRRGTTLRLDDGRRRMRLRARAGLVTATGPDDEFTARRSETAGCRRWEITADGVRLTFDVRSRHPVPRRTLVDDDGVAWLVRLDPARRGRVHPTARLPERLSPLAAAFVVWVLAELDATIRAARDAPLTGGSGRDGGDSTWWDTGSPGSESSGGSGGDSGGSFDGGGGGGGGGD